MIIKDNGNRSRLVQGTALALTRRDPGLAAAASKAVASLQGTAHDNRGQRQSPISELYSFHNALTQRARRNSDAKALLRMLPDMELGAQILVSSILAPKDMLEPELIYSLGNSEDMQSELATTLIERFRKHFTEVYPVLKKLPEMVRDPLMEKGSYPVAVIPENAIDEVINGRRVAAMESLDKLLFPTGVPRPVGILGSGREKPTSSKLNVSMESWNRSPAQVGEQDVYMQYDREKFGLTQSMPNHEQFLLITDNVAALKTGVLVEYLNKKNTREAMTTALESLNMSAVTRVSDLEIERAIFRPRNPKQITVDSMPAQHETKRRFVGNPLVMKLPSESVIPVFVPGDPSNHIGYYVVLDEHGNPISAPDADVLHPSATGTPNSSNNPVQSNLMQRAAANLGMADHQAFDMMNRQHMQAAVRVYGQMIERDLINRIRNGVTGAHVAIAKNENIYRLMLSRVLARQYTQVLYLPTEYMTYIAFNHGDDGIGRSLMDDQAMLGMLRASLLFADLIGSIKNSIGRTNVKVKLPESDPDSMKTIETIMHQVVDARQLKFPMTTNPADITHFLQSASLDFQWSGNSDVPDLTIDYEQQTTNFPKPDTDLREQLKKASSMGLGLPPELIDQAFSPEFAASVLASNSLLSKRVISWQDKFTPQLTNHMRQHARYSEQLLDDLFGILMENSDKILLEIDKVEGASTQPDEEHKKRLVATYVLRKILDNFTVSLPKPSSVTLEAQIEELNKYSEGLDKALEAYITPEMFAENTVGELTTQMATMRSMIKAHFQRKFMVERGIFTELGAMLSVDTQGGQQAKLVEEIQNHIKSLTEAGVVTLIELSANRDAATRDLKNSNAIPGPELPGSSFSSGGTGGSDAFGGGMDDLGGGDLDLGGGDGLDNLETDDPGTADEQPGEGTGTDGQSNDTSQGASGADTTSGGTA